MAKKPTTQAPTPQPKTVGAVPNRTEEVATVQAVAAAGAKADQWNRPAKPPRVCTCGGANWEGIPVSAPGSGSGRKAWRCFACGEVFVDGIAVTSRMSPGLRLYGHFRAGLLAAYVCSSKGGIGPDVPSWPELTGQEQQAWEFAAASDVVFNVLTGEVAHRTDAEASFIRGWRSSRQK